MAFTRNALGVLTTTTAVTLIRLMVAIALARLLSATDLGAFAVVISFSAISMLIAQVGLSSAAVYRIKRLREPPPQVAGSLLLLVGIISAITAGLLLALEEPLSSRILEGAPVSAYRFGIALCLLDLPGMVFVGVARAVDRFDLANRYLVLASLPQLLGLLVVLGGFDGALSEALAVTVLARVIATVDLLGAVLRVTGLSLANCAARLAPTLTYGAKSHAQSLAGSLHEQVDVFMLAYLLHDTAEIAVYSIAVAITMRLKLVPAALATALFPEVAGRSDAQAAAFTARTLRHSVLAASLLALAVAAVSPIAVPLAFGEEYRASVPILFVLLPGMALMSNFMLLGHYFMAVNRQQFPIVTQLATLVLNVTLNLLLIPRYGIFGAALASLASYLIEFALITIAFVRTTEQSASEALVVRRAELRNASTRLAQWWRTGASPNR